VIQSTDAFVTLHLSNRSFIITMPLLGGAGGLS